MAFVAGYNGRYIFAGYNLSSYLNSVDISGETDLPDVSTFGDAFRDFIPTLKSGSISCSGFSDNAAAAVTAVFGAAFGGNNKIVTAFPEGDTITKLGFGMSAMESTYSITAPVSGVTEISASFQSNTAMEPLISLHALAAETSTGNGTAVDNSGATSNGGAGYLQVTAFSGTDITISVNHSTDNFAANNVQLLAFAQVTAANSAERVAFTGTCNRYRRIVIAGTFTSCTFQVGLNSK